MNLTNEQLIDTIISYGRLGRVPCERLKILRAELLRRLSLAECCTSKPLHPADVADMGMS